MLQKTSLPKTVFYLLIFFFTLQFGFSQDLTVKSNNAALELNQPLERKISKDNETHSFQIFLNENQYAKILVNQDEIDISAQLFAPGDVAVSTFDYEPRLKEKEEIKFVAERTGNYRLDVKAKYRNSAGRYEIRLTEIRGANERDRAFFEAHILCRKSEEFDLVGKYDDALSAAARALEIAEKQSPPDDALTGFLLNRLGAAQRRKGDYRKAEATLQRAFAVNEKTLGPEHPRTVDTMRHSGLVYLATDDFAKADKFFQQAIAITAKTLGADHPRMVYHFLGAQVLAMYLDDYEQTEKYGQRALAIAEKKYEPDHVVMTYILNNLGVVYQSRGDYQKSEQILRRVLGIYERTIGTENNDYALTLQNLGNNVRRRKDFPQALAIYERALAIREKTLGREHLNLAPLLINIGAIYHAEGNYAKAVEIQKRAFDIAQKKGGLYHEYTFTALGNTANSYAAQGDIANALVFETLAQERIETALALNLAIGSERLKLIQLDSTTKKTSRAISLNVTLLSDNAKANEMAALLILQRKGRVLDAMSESFAALRKRAGVEDQNLLNRLTSITEQLANAALGKTSKTTLEEQRKQIADLTEQKESLEVEISRRNAEFRVASQTVTLDAVKAEIPNDAALIEFAVYNPFDPKPKNDGNASGEPRYIAYVLRKNGEVKYAELGDKKTIDKTIDDWRKSLRDPKRNDVKQLARAADGKIMQPIRALLGDSKHLLISPDGELNLIPFESLVDEKDKYLIENYSFAYLTSGRDLLRLKTARAGDNKFVIIANPSFGEAKTNESSNGRDKINRGIAATRNMADTYFAPLGGTIQEAHSIQAQFPDATLLIGKQANETALKQVVAPRILHIATHGFFLEDTGEIQADSNSPNRNSKAEIETQNPLLRSGLALAGANRRDGGAKDNGVLTALEASGLNLWGTKLVVLSACDTGLGEVKNGEGVYGLRRAFVLAGTESLVMSLWSVSDAVTRELMTNYYKNLKSGMGRGAALRQVQLVMLKKPNRQHPFYWAAFIQSGEWANLDGKR